MAKSRADVLEYLDVLKSFLIIEDVTEPFKSMDGEVDPEILKAAPSQNWCNKVTDQWTYPKVEHNGKILFYFKDSNMQFIGSIGSAQDNRPFVRIMRSEDKKDLYVVFRPLNIAPKVDYLKVGLHQYTMDMLSKAANDVDGKPTASKLSGVIYETQNRAIGKDGARAGDLALLNWKYRFCDYLSGTGAVTDKGIPMIVASFIQQYKPRKVYFTGFSLGASMSAVCAGVTSKILNGRSNHPPFSIISCCGEPPGDKNFVQYLVHNTAQYINVVVYKDKISMVSGKLVNPPNTMLVTYTDGGTVDMIKRPYSQEKNPRSAYDDMWGHFRGKNSTFKQFHLSAEEIVPLILWQKIAKMGGYKRYVEIEQSNYNKYLCNWYSEIAENGKKKPKKFVLRNGICPPSDCTYTILKERVPGRSARQATCKKGSAPRVQVQKTSYTDEDMKVDPPDDKTLPVGPTTILGKLQKLLGSHYASLIAAEHAYIGAVNDLDVRTYIVRNIINSVPDGASYKYLGTFLLMADAKYDALPAKDSLRSETIPSRQLSQLLAHPAMVNSTKKIVFIVGGSFLPETDITHYLSFVWAPRERVVVMFNPGVACWAPGLSRMVVDAVKAGVGHKAVFVEDQFTAFGSGAVELSLAGLTINRVAWYRKFGPQDITRRGTWQDDVTDLIPATIRNYAYTMDSFCQTWTMFWIANFVSGHPITDKPLQKIHGIFSRSCNWPNTPPKLDLCIRRFVMWILAKFPKIHHIANDIFKKETGEKRDVLKEMMEGFQKFYPGIMTAEPGMCCFDFSKNPTDVAPEKSRKRSSNRSPSPVREVAKLIPKRVKLISSRHKRKHNKSRGRDKHRDSIDKPRGRSSNRRDRNKKYPIIYKRSHANRSRSRR